MATRRVLVKDLDISWKEANTYVLQAEKDLGMSASEDQIITYAKDVWSAKTGKNEEDVNPVATSPAVEETENTTDPSVDTQQDDAILKDGEEEHPEKVVEQGEEEEEEDDDDEPEPSADKKEETEEAAPVESPPSTPIRASASEESAGVSTSIETVDPSTPVRASMIDKTPPSAASSVAPAAPRKSLRVAFYDLGSSDVDIVLSALTELTEMNLHSRKHKKKTKEVISQGAAPMGVLQAMRNHGKTNADVAEKCFALLLALTATGEKDCQNALMELDGTASILAVMKCHMGHENVNIQVHGLGLLCNLSATTAGEATRISKNAGVDVIIQDMKEFPDLSFVQRRACKCFANLIYIQPRLKEEIRSKEGVSTIGAALESFPEGSSTYIEARRAMSCFL